MRVLIHCNGGPEIGVGHVVRSLALAEEAALSGNEVVIVGELQGDFVQRLLSDAGVATKFLGRDDSDGLRQLIVESSPDVVHVDSYDFERWSPVGRPTFVSNIEDGSFGRRAADLVIDPNYGSEQVDRGDTDPVTTLLRGSRYVPLRTSVTRYRGAWRPSDRVERVLVVMGGADSAQLIPRALDVLDMTGQRLSVTAIARPERHAELRQQAADYAHLNVEILAPTGDLPTLMVQQDLVVSAAGTSVWELCCLGVPMALVCAVDNQQAGYSRVVEEGAATGLGTLREPDLTAAAAVLRNALDDPAGIHQTAACAAEVVDGLGAWRVIRAWEHLTAQQAPAKHGSWSVMSREATMADAERLLRWRNDPATRANSRAHGEVALEQHLAWLESTLSRDDRLLLILFDEDGDLGSVRWDRRAPGSWEVSITVAPARRGESKARLLLSAAEQALQRDHPEPLALLAVVHRDNEASRRLFAGASYLPDHPADEAGFELFRKAVWPSWLSR